MNSMSIRTRLMVSVGIAVFIMVTFNGVFNYTQARSTLKENVEEIITLTGDSTTQFVSQWFKNKSMVITGGKEALEMGHEIMTTVQHAQLAAKFQVTYVGRSDGIIETYPAISLPDGYDPRQRPWFIQAQQENKQIVTAPYQDAFTDSLVMTFAEPVGGHVIAADVSLQEVINEILGVKLGETGYAALIDGEGKYLVHPKKDKVGKSVGSKRLTTTPSIVEEDDDSWFAAAFPIEGVDWKLILMMEESDAMSAVGGLAWTNIIVSALTILLVTSVSGFMISKLLGPLVILSKAMSDISRGDADLTKRLNESSSDEIGLLSKNFNSFVASIHDLVTDSISSSHRLTDLSQAARENAQENNRSIQIQQSEISQVAAAINEMSTTSSQVAENAADTANAAERAYDEGSKGMENAEENRRRMGNLTRQIESTTEAITRLDEQALQINSILSTIQGIAEQTNLLALNAAIEAARAGEQGRGFAVVADEVRALSGRTHEATGEIQNVIKELQEQTQNAVAIMETSKDLTSETEASAEEVTQNLMRIAESVEDISSRASTIANASREQYTSTEEINRIATAIHDASNQLAENVHKATSESEELHDLSRDIDANLSRFKV